MFSYQSHQEHTMMVNGQKTTRQNSVKIRNGKGQKMVVVKENNKTRRSARPLTEKEINCIRQGQFIPGLFRDCQPQRHQRTRTPHSQTRRNSKKKNHRSKN